MNEMMLKTYLKLQALMNREEGQDLVEYGLLVVLIGSGCDRIDEQSGDRHQHGVCQRGDKLDLTDLR